MSLKPAAWASLGSATAAVVATVFVMEGGYVNHPDDPGGATNHGITEQVARQHGYTGDMRDLSRDLAERIYVRDYVERPGFADVLAMSPALGHKLVDAGVNAGPARVSRWFQQALNDLSRGGADYPRIGVDGAIGPRTLAAFASLQRVRGRVGACELIIKLIDVQQGAHYMRQGQPAFMVGWVNTRIGNIPLERCGEVVLAGGEK